MREIKFRAWDNIHKIMSPVGALEFKESGQPRALIYQPVQMNEDGDVDWDADIVGSIDLMQFTGLKDKNGKEIYEGDVVEWWSCEFIDNEPHDEHDPECHLDGGVIKYDENRMRFCVESYGDLYDYPYNRPVSVIGNFYENQELLTNNN